MDRPDWITEVEGSHGTNFLIRQRRGLALQIVRVSVITLTVLIVLVVLCGTYADRHPGSGNNSGILTLVFIGFTVIWGLATLAITALFLPIYFMTKDWSEFCIGPDSVMLIRKLKVSFPDRIPRDQISEFFVFSPQGRNPALTVSVTTTVYPTTVSGAIVHGANQVSSIVNEAVGGMAQLYARFNCGVRINARGSEIPLASGLSSTEADFLFYRLKGAFAKAPSLPMGAGSASTSPRRTAPPSLTLPDKGSPLREWAWLPIVVVILVSLRWVLPALEPRSQSAPISAAQSNREERQRFEQSLAAFGKRLQDATDHDSCGVTAFLASGSGSIVPNAQYKNRRNHPYLSTAPGKSYPVNDPLQLCKVNFQNSHVYIVADPQFNEAFRRAGERHAFVFNVTDRFTEAYTAGNARVAATTTDAAVPVPPPAIAPSATSPGQASGSTAPAEITR
jgi:hypothetical protein